MILFFAYLNALLSILAVVGLTFSALGWRHSLRPPIGTPEWFFAMAKVLFATGLAIRLILWDVAWGIYYHITPFDAWFYSARVGHTNINIFSTAIVLLGVYCSLKARQLLLLYDKNINWHWTIAWAYPRASIIVKAVTRNGRLWK